VSLKVSGGGYNLLTREEFMALELKERISKILKKEVEFFDAEGNKIPVVEAIKLIRLK